jgi:hypothetical protein
VNAKTAGLLLAYYDGGPDGTACYAEKRLRSILAPDMMFEGPMAGRKSSGTRSLRDLSRSSDSMRPSSGNCWLDRNPAVAPGPVEGRLALKPNVSWS